MSHREPDQKPQEERDLDEEWSEKEERLVEDARRHRDQDPTTFDEVDEEDFESFEDDPGEFERKE